jgi:hypothetical protein
MRNAYWENGETTTKLKSMTFNCEGIETRVTPDMIRAVDIEQLTLIGREK